MRWLIPAIGIAAIWYTVIGFISVRLTRLDKRRAQQDKWRIPEHTLLLCGLLGGALPMYVTMKKIRHKTKHKKFMLGLPLEILLHSLIWIGLMWIHSALFSF